MLVLHVNWAGDGLRLWAESLSVYHGTTTTDADTHPFAVDAAELSRTLIEADLIDEASLGACEPIRLMLPCNLESPCPSDRLSIAAGEVESGTAVELRPVEIPAVALDNAHALAAVLRLEDRGPTDEIAFAHSLPWWIALARFVLELLEDQRFIPTLIHAAGDEDGLRAAWRPWLLDESARDRLAALMAAMPPVIRATQQAGQSADPWRILREAVETLSDATVRFSLIDGDFIAAIDGRDASIDPSVAWLGGLLEKAERVPVAGDRKSVV